MASIFFPAHELVTVQRNSQGIACLYVETGALAQTVLEDFHVTFQDRKGWQQAWRLARVSLAYGFQVLPVKLFDLPGSKQ